MIKPLIDGLFTGLILQFALGPVFIYIVNLSISRTVYDALAGAVAATIVDYREPRKIANSTSTASIVSLMCMFFREIMKFCLHSMIFLVSMSTNDPKASWERPLPIAPL